MRPQLVVFDCDGTLVDSAALIIASMAATFTRAGLPVPKDEEVRAIVGLSLERAMVELAPEHEDVAVLADHYRREFGRLRASGTYSEQLFPGIGELLLDLDQAGYLMAVATGKSARGMAFLIDHHGLEGRFVSVQTADGNPSKPHPEMLRRALSEAGVEATNAVMVGDTTFDVEMARAAGVRAVGVSWGHHPSRLLAAAGADPVVHDTAELARALAL